MPRNSFIWAAWCASFDVCYSRACPNSWIHSFTELHLAAAKETLDSPQDSLFPWDTFRIDPSLFPLDTFRIDPKRLVPLQNGCEVVPDAHQFRRGERAAPPRAREAAAHRQWPERVPRQEAKTGVRHSSDSSVTAPASVETQRKVFWCCGHVYVGTLISAMDFPVGKRRRIIKRRHSVKKNIFIFL